MQSHPVIDLHVHAVSFGDSGSGCRISQTLHRRPSVRLLNRRQTHAPGIVDHAVLLAFDAVYDEAGRRDEARTHLSVPNEYVEALGRTDPRILAGASTASLTPSRAT